MDFSFEAAAYAAGARSVAGVDEVGLGSGAGPLVVCAYVADPGRACIDGVIDSKQLSAARRVILADVLRSSGSLAIGAASAAEIDILGLRPAHVLAIRRAIGRLPQPAEVILLDGLPIAGLAGLPVTALVKGDTRCYSIAAASIIAKVFRDRLMTRLADRYPAYGWGQNAGYLTAAHLAALDLVGVSVHHRWSFRPVTERLLSPDPTVAATEVALLRRQASRQASSARSVDPNYPE